VTNVPGFSGPFGIVYDGSNIWVTEVGSATLRKLDSSGAVLQTVSFGTGHSPRQPTFDGANIWVPLSPDSVAVVRASSGTVTATLTGNGLSGPAFAAFDGERVLVTNETGDSVSLWRAADLAPLGSFPLGSDALPAGVCSDGLNFWIALLGSGQLARF
jgi:DNA-binding beta-propeller fold protein YncE